MRRRYCPRDAPPLPPIPGTAVQSQTAVCAHFSSEHILLFGFARRGYPATRKTPGIWFIPRSGAAGHWSESKMKWNESGFRPPLCTYRLNWARRTSWGWWDDWDDTVLQTQDSKFEPWRSEAEHATSRSRRLPTILTFTRGWGRNIFVSFKPPRPGTEPRTLAWKAAVLTTTLGPPPWSESKTSRAPLAAVRFLTLRGSDRGY